MARRHREILDVLLDRIVDGQYAPGDLLPKEELLKAEFNVSRGTGREALRALEERRVAVVKHGWGATVQPPEEWNVLDPAVARALAAGRRRRAFLAELAESRALLQGAIAALAAERAGARQRPAIAAAADRAAAGEPGAPRELWRLVAVAAGNRPLAAMLRALSEAHDPGPQVAAEYGQLGAAITGAEPAAARAAAGRLG